MGSKTMRREWERNLAAYRIAAALTDAGASFGPFARENDAFDLAKRRLEDRHGSITRAKLEPEAGAEWAEVWARMGEAEEVRYRELLKPMWAAAIRLVLTPAPDLEAALIKVEIIKHEELDNDADMTPTRSRW
jgi:hypothetical protein